MRNRSQVVWGPGERFPWLSDSGASRRGQVLDEVSTAIHGSVAAMNDLHHQRPAQACHVRAAELLAVW